MKKRLLSTLLALCMALSLLPATALAADPRYALEGGDMWYDPATGTIKGCSSDVTVANIPSEINGVTITAIGINAFEGCKKLTEITIPNTVTSIGDGAFTGCSQLTSVVIPDSVTVLGQFAFSSCNRLESVTIPGSVKTLPWQLFQRCSMLKTVDLGEGIEVIGKGAFFGCSRALQSITLPDSVKTVEDGAFVLCEALETATIGSGIETLGENVFSDTDRLISVYFRGNAPAASSKTILNGAKGFTIYYPEGASGWTTPTWNSYPTKSYSLSDGVPVPSTPAESEKPTTPATPSTPAGGTAYASTQTVELDGKKVEFQMYALKEANGGLTNYVKVRDLAFALNGTKAQFSVDWDGQVNLVAGEAYTPNGSENSTPFSGDRAYTVPTSPTNVNGAASDLAAITLTDDNGGNYNYYKLRDLGSKLGFNVDWTAERGVFIESDKPYGG